MSKSAAQQLEEIAKQHGFTVPDRGMKGIGDKAQWRNREKPDYAGADLFFFKGKSKNHPAGSLEMVVENLVKRWEMEITHLVKPSDCTTMEVEDFRMKVNHGKELDANEIIERGSYNSLLKDISKEVYDSEGQTFDSSQDLFRNAFEEGFGWELLEVFSGPPKVAFLWRHWGKFTGEYKGRKGDGEVIEMYGFTVVTVNDDFKLTRVEIYFKPEGFLRCLEGKVSPDDEFQGKSLFGSCCPIHNAS